MNMKLDNIVIDSLESEPLTTKVARFLSTI